MSANPVSFSSGKSNPSIPSPTSSNSSFTGASNKSASATNTSVAPCPGCPQMADFDRVKALLDKMSGK
eukprot:Awhi_evm1s7076